MVQVKVTINSADAFDKIRNALSGFGRRRVQRAMGIAFRDIARSNFGAIGVDRPAPWPPYSRNYSDYGKQKGSPATLIRTGRLQQSIYVDSGHDGYVEVGDDTRYGAAHQFGVAGKTPARPFFPITKSGIEYRLTAHAQSVLEKAATDELNEMLRDA